jgi:hypothetical protein
LADARPTEENNFGNDAVLLPFLTAATTAEGDRLLADLLETHVAPVIEKTLRHKLRSSLLPSDTSSGNQDALELAGEAKLHVVAALHRLKSNRGDRTIGNLGGYAAAVTANVYRQYLRTKYPLREQLKNKLRYLLTHHGRFVLWNDEHGGRLCGLKEWDPERRQWPERRSAESISTELAGLADERHLRDPARIIELVDAVFGRAGAPLAFGDLLKLVAEIQGLKDSPNLPEPDFEEPGQAGTPAFSQKEFIVIERREQLQKVWEELCRLPVRHRVVLLLNLKDRRGECVTRLFPLLRIASIRRIAEALEFPPDEFAAVWRELPWDDFKIAARLNLTRQQVINLRQSARARLLRELGKNA